MIPRLAIVGKSDVGKTVLIERLVRELTAHGVRVGVIKHHAHPTPLDVPGKDSARFADAGAAVVVAASPIEIARFERTPRALTLAEIASRIQGVDIILVEGFKREPGPKLQVSRAARGTDLIEGLDEVVGVVADHPVDVSGPLFDLNDTVGVADFIVRRLLSGAQSAEET